jgi:predicted RNA methylase
MILNYLLDMDIDDKAVLDMGCGTGVLGILA